MSQQKWNGHERRLEGYPVSSTADHRSKIVSFALGSIFYYHVPWKQNPTSRRQGTLPSLKCI